MLLRMMAPAAKAMLPWMLPTGPKEAEAMTRLVQFLTHRPRASGNVDLCYKSIMERDVVLNDDYRSGGGNGDVG